MDAVVLNDRMIVGWKPKTSVQEIRDSKSPLRMLVHPSGLKAFQVRKKVDGKSKRITLGRFPQLSLKDARLAALAIDLSGPPQKTPNDASPTMTAAFGHYMAKDGNKAKSADEKWRIFRKDIEPTLGPRVLTDITRHDLAAVIAAKHDTAPTASNALQALLSKFYNWSCDEGWSFTKLETSPMARVKKMSKPQTRKRWLSEQELRWFFQALPAACEFAPVFELILRTMVRRSEAFSADRADIKGNLWTLKDTKNGSDFLVWLSESALRLVPASGGFQLCEEAVSKPMDRLRARMNELAGKELDRWTLHDLRRSGRTHLGSMLDENFRPWVARDTLEAMLNHTLQGMDKVYNLNSFLPEKKAGWERWNDYLDTLV